MAWWQIKSTLNQGKWKSTWYAKKTRFRFHCSLKGNHFPKPGECAINDLALHSSSELTLTIAHETFFFVVDLVNGRHNVGCASTRKIPCVSFEMVEMPRRSVELAS